MYDYDVFISYRGDEEGRALRDALDEILRPHLTVYFDEVGLPRGQGPEALDRLIERSRNFLVALTPGWEGRPYCDGELERAESYNKHVVVCVSRKESGAKKPFAVGARVPFDLENQSDHLIWTLLPVDRQRARRKDLAFKALAGLDVTQKGVLETAAAGHHPTVAQPLQAIILRYAETGDLGELNRLTDTCPAAVQPLSNFLSQLPHYHRARTASDASAPTGPTQAPGDTLLKRFLSSYPSPLLGEALPRPEVQRLVDRLLGGAAVTLLTGAPGGGKSTVLCEVVRRLAKHPDVDVLALRIDRDLQDTVTDLGLQLGLHGSLPEALANPRLVVVIDQLDALHELAGARSDLIEVVLRLLTDIHRAGRPLLLCGRDNELQDLPALSKLLAEIDAGWGSDAKVTIAPFGEHEIVEHLTRWRLHDALAPSLSIATLTPFDLDLLHAAATTKVPTGGWTRPRLLDAFVERAVRHAKASDREAPVDEAVKQLVERLSVGVRSYEVDAKWSGEQLRAVDALATAGLLVHNVPTTAFRHQRVAEHLLARAALDRGSPRAWLMGLEHQDLPYRPILHHVLELRLDDAPEEFVTEAIELLEPPVRPHMQVILADVLRLRGDPAGREADVVAHLLGAENDFHRRLGWSIVSRQAHWCSWLLTNDRWRGLHTTEMQLLPELLAKASEELPESTGAVLACLVADEHYSAVRRSVLWLRKLPSTWVGSLLEATRAGAFEHPDQDGGQGFDRLLTLVGSTGPDEVESTLLLAELFDRFDRRRLHVRSTDDWGAARRAVENHPRAFLAALQDMLGRFATEARFASSPSDDWLAPFPYAERGPTYASTLIDLVKRAIQAAASTASSESELLPASVLGSSTKTARLLTEYANSALAGAPAVPPPEAHPSDTAEIVPVSLNAGAPASRDPAQLANDDLHEALRVLRETDAQGDLLTEATRHDPQRLLRWLARLPDAEDCVRARPWVLRGLCSPKHNTGDGSGLDWSSIAEPHVLAALRCPDRSSWEPAAEALCAHPAWGWDPDVVRAVVARAEDPAAAERHRSSLCMDAGVPVYQVGGLSDRAAFIRCLLRLLYGDLARWRLVEAAIRRAVADPDPNVRIVCAFAAIAFIDGNREHESIAVELYRGLVTDTIDGVLATHDALTALTHLKWRWWDDLLPILERMVASEVDEVAEQGAIQVAVATLAEGRVMRKALELTHRCLTSDRPAHRRGVAQVVAHNPDVATRHPVVGALWPHWLHRLCDDEDDQVVKHAMFWSAHAEPISDQPSLFGATLGTRGLDVEPYRLLHELNVAPCLRPGWIFALFKGGGSRPMNEHFWRGDGLTLLRRAALQDRAHRAAWLDLMDDTVQGFKRPSEFLPVP